MQVHSLHVYAPIIEVAKEYSIATALLSKHATRLVTLLPPSSGYSKDIDGTMIVEAREPHS